MASYRWADVASSESCASFGRTALMLLERPNRLTTGSQYVVHSDDATSALKRSVHLARLGDSSYYDKSKTTHEKTKVALALKDKMKLSNSPKAGCMHENMGDDYGAPLDILNEYSHPLGSPADCIPETPSFAGILESTRVPSGAESVSKTPSNTCTPTHSTGSVQNKDSGPWAVSCKDATVKKVALKIDNKRTLSHASVSYDDDTREPLNPTKRTTIRREHLDEGAKKRIETLLLDHFKGDKRSNGKRSKDAAARVYSRLKDIAIGKATRGYQNYIKRVPIEERGPDDPQTPNCKDNVSVSMFAAFYSKWRKQLHKYD